MAGGRGTLATATAKDRVEFFVDLGLTVFEIVAIAVVVWIGWTEAPGPGRRRRESIRAHAAGASRSASRPACAAAWAEGRAMTLEQAVAYALDEQPPA